MAKLSTRDASAITAQVRDHAPFDTHGALSGRAYVPSFGMLPSEYRDMLRDTEEHVTYVLSSYGTPIAWRYSDGSWILPAVKYSVTTGRHQGVARRVAAAV